jgi:sugar phosphate isomerase/epimerase
MKKIVCFLFVCCFFIGNAFAQRFSKSFKNTPGIQSYSFRDSFEKNVGTTLDTIKSMGITNIEFAGLYGKSAEEMRKMIDERGMVCTSFGAGYNTLMEKTDEIAAIAKQLGASYIMVAWIPHDNKTGFTISDAKKAVNDFNKVGKALMEKYNITLCYHNHGYEFRPFENGTLFDYIVKNTDPRYVSFEMDVLWVAHPGADPAALLKKYKQRFKLMHLKDLRRGVTGDFSGGTSVLNDVIIGTGQIDIKAVVEMAQKTAIEYFYIEDESPYVATQVPASLAFLKSL